MRIKPTIGSVIASTNDVHWGQVLILPTAYGVIEVEDERGNAQNIGLLLLQHLSEKLNQPIVSLSELEEVASLFHSPHLVGAAILVPVGMVAYLLLAGSGGVYLSRKDRLSKLLSSPGSLSGTLVPRDTLLLVTGSFIRAIGEQDLLGLFQEHDQSGQEEAGDLAGKLTMRISEAEGGTGAAGLVFRVDRTIATEEESTPAVLVAAPEVIKEPTEHNKLRRYVRVLGKYGSGVVHGGYRWWQKIRKRFSGRNGIIALVALVSLGVFLVSVGLGIRKQYINRTQASVIESLTEAQHAFDEGSALLDLNPVKGRERLSVAKEIVDTLTVSVSPKTKTGREVAKLSEEINGRLTVAMQVYRGDPALLYDASLLKKGASILSMDIASDQLVMLDGAGKTVFSLMLTSKNGQVIGGGEVYTTGRSVVLGGDKAYVLVSDGIHMIRTTDKKTEQFVVKKDDEWGSVASLVSFGGNLYLLDTAKSRIWKYVATATGFSEKREYLNPDTLPDLTWATNMVIDGSVWVGTTTGKIMRFAQGQENTFTPQGVLPEFGKTLQVYTGSDVTHVYVLDADNKRVVVLGKDGMYVSQFVWESDFKPTQILVSETLKKIILLIDGKMYAFDLK